MNIGIDIVENKRLENKSERFIDLVLTPKEKELYRENGLLFLCGRYACKEAVMKALPNTKNLSMLDIEILKNKDGEPTCNIEGIKVSISHEKKYTTATALYIEKKSTKK